jgi:DNA topoisomerase-1
VDLEFLGKDSILFKQSIDFAAFDEHGQQAYENIREMCNSKKVAEQVFELIEPTSLNAHLSSIMPGLTAKVFRTYNASETLQNQLPNAESVLKMKAIGDKLVAYNEANRSVAILCNHQRTVSAAAATGLEAQADKLEQLKDQRRELQAMRTALKGGKKKEIQLHSGQDPTKEAQADVDAAKSLKNDAKTHEQKIAATTAYEAAMSKKREANKSKQAEAHRFARPPDDKDVVKRINSWTEKIKKLEIDLRNKEENKEVSLGTSKANYLDPRISVAWCKRCDVPIEKLFSKSLKEKFAWALTVEPDWRFEALPITGS